MKKIYMLFFIVAIFFIAGCSSMFNSETSGIIAGKGLYIAYEKVSENKDAEFKEKVTSLWTYVNNINSTDDLTSSYNILKEKVDDCINSQELSDSDKKILKSISDDILNKVSSIINDKLSSNEDGVQFLLGVREGVNSMISNK